MKTAEEVTVKRRRVIRLEEDAEKSAHKRALKHHVGRLGMWPLNAPEMPAPGPDFLRVAQLMGDGSEYVKGTKKQAAIFTPGEKLNEMHLRALREPGFTLDVQVRPGRTETVSFVPGHVWGQHANEWAMSHADSTSTPTPVDGPQPADVMVLGKMPWKEETNEGRNLVGPTGQMLSELIAKLHIKGARKWYVTNLVKFMPPDGVTQLKAGWIKDCLPLLHQELRIVRPKYILCLGADASKELLGDQYGVNNMMGRIIPLRIRLNPDNETDPEYHTAHVMTVTHPASVLKDPAQMRLLESNMGRFANVLRTNNLDLEERGLDHRSCYCLEDAVDWAQEAEFDLSEQPANLRLTGWDLEWEGQHPVNPGSYIRTIQCSWGDKKAITFVIKHPGGQTAFRDREGKPAIKRLITLLNSFVKCSRPVGHFLVADMEWAEHVGLRLTDHCQIPLYAEDGKPAWQQLRDGKGWIDTAYMNHAIEETAPLGLETLAMRYTMAPRYDIPLEEWKTEYCKQLKLEKKGLEGYGNCPDKILIPYANYDADVTRRIAIALMPMLDCDYEGNNCWEPFWESMIIQKPILRIHQVGIRVDRARVDDLTIKFMKWRDIKEQEVREKTKWPEFNIRSVMQVKEYLFGEHLNGKRDAENNTIRLRPKDAVSLYVEPLMDTSKPPRRWRDLVEKNLHRDASPSTGKMILGILAQDNSNVADEINMIRDYRFLDQVLKSMLRKPKADENDNWIENDNGELEYDAGLVKSVDFDGRVRTHLYPTAETGRWKSSRPNLQNISKSRDPDYRRLLGGIKDAAGKYSGGDYTHSLRSVFRASEGFALVEADYKTAELFVMAVMSGSDKMREHCERANFPDEGYDEHGKEVAGGKFAHPRYYDIHSNVAVLAFRLKCEPTKRGLKSIGKEHFRTLAKNVIFGIAYGRQAKAIALQAREQGVRVTPDEAQKVIDAIFEMYPELEPFFAEAKSRAKREKWLCHCFGRFRRFPSTGDYKLEGEFERQSMNFPIQGAVASAVDRAIAFLQDIIEREGLQNDIRILLQIHDAILLEAKHEYVDYAAKLIKWAMVDMVEIWPTDLAGQPRGDGPYHLGLDFEVSESHWGEKISKPRCLELGIPVSYGK